MNLMAFLCLSEKLGPQTLSFSEIMLPGIKGVAGSVPECPSAVIAFPVRHPGWSGFKTRDTC